MKLIDDVKKAYDGASDDDKPFLIFVGVLAAAVVIAIGIGILAILAALVKELFFPVAGVIIFWFGLKLLTGSSPLDWAKKLIK